VTLRAPRHAPLIATTRGGHVERVHYGSIAVVDEAGVLVAGAGDPQSLNFTRSALKPLQALPFVDDDGPARFGFSSYEVALMCASHSGEAMHVEVAQRMLDRIGASERDLQCGCHAPTYFSHIGEPVPPTARYSQLHHNCSGKHSGFLAFNRLHGEPLAGYLDPDAPLQRRIRQEAFRYAGGREPVMGIDGCSAPNFALPLTGLARLFGDLAAGRTPALRALAFAMTRHPDLVSGTRRSDLALMQTGARQSPGDWVAKVGADGVQAVGIRSRGLGIALRIADGDMRALLAATVELLVQLHLLDDPSSTPLARWARPALKNARGTTVGHMLPLFTLT
jgi:L-asparaginase II